MTSDYRNDVSSPANEQIVHVTTGRNFPIRHDKSGMLIESWKDELPVIRPGAVDTCHPLMVRYSLTYGSRPTSG